MRRHPEALADATFQPIMFVLLFAYVFGGAIAVPGDGSYKEFLMGGIFAQTIVFGTFGVAMSLATDRQSGAIDRFHSLPIQPGCVLAGHAPWEHRTVRMYDRMVEEPRLTAWYGRTLGDPSVPPILTEMAAALCARYGRAFDGVGAALYRDGRDSVAWHADRIDPTIIEPVVAIVSETRAIGMDAIASPAPTNELVVRPCAISSALVASRSAISGSIEPKMVSLLFMML